MGEPMMGEPGVGEPGVGEPGVDGPAAIPAARRAGAVLAIAAAAVLAGCASTGPAGAPVSHRAGGPSAAGPSGIAGVAGAAQGANAGTSAGPGGASAAGGAGGVGDRAADGDGLPPAASARAGQRGSSGAYYLDDGPGQVDAARLAAGIALPDPEPREEPLHPRANRPYTALGRRYEPMTRREPYRQTGVASWYGRRYHGNATSTGEPYDMYSMTAAHPTLPLPSYVRVTNRANGRSVVVRVNDRGPFLRDRVIDLSYLAAHKLDYLDAGSAVVDVEVLLSGPTGMMASTVPAPAPASASASAGQTVASTARVFAAPMPPPASTTLSISTATPVSMATPVAVAPSASAASPASGGPTVPATPAPAGHYLQLGAFRGRDGAEAEAGRLRAAPELRGAPLAVVEDGGLFRVKAGPWVVRDQAVAVAAAVTARTGLRPMVVERATTTGDPGGGPGR